MTTRTAQRTYTVTARGPSGAFYDLHIRIGLARKYWQVWMEPAEWDRNLYPYALDVLHTKSDRITSRLKDLDGPFGTAIFENGKPKTAEIGGWGGYWAYGSGLSREGAEFWAQTLHTHVESCVGEIETMALKDAYTNG